MKHIQVKHVFQTWDLDLTESAMWKYNDDNTNKLFINWFRKWVIAKLSAKIVTLNDICSYLGLPSMETGRFYGLMPGDDVNIWYTNDGILQIECRDLDY